MSSRLNRLLCKVFGHDFYEFHMYEVVCKRCRVCRGYTAEDIVNLEVEEMKKRGMV